MVLGGILTQAILLLIYQSARLLMSEKRAFWTGVLAVFFLPFYYYAQIAIQMFPGCLHWLLWCIYMYLQKRRKTVKANIYGLFYLVV